MKNNDALKRLILHAVCLLSLLLILGNASFAQTWQQEGTAQFTNNASALSSVHHPTADSIYYVAYADATDGDKLKVKMYNGASWEDVGATISVVEASLLSIKINPVTNEPWVAYRRATANKLNVRKYDSNTDTWLDAGTDISSFDPIQKVQLNFSPEGDAYVGYLDAQYGNTTEPVTKIMTNKSGSWVVSHDEVGYGRQWGFDYPSYDKVYVLRAYGASGSPNSYINRKTLNTNGTWSTATVAQDLPKLAGLATNSINNFWLSKNITGSNLVSNMPTPPASNGAHGSYLQLEYNPIDGFFYFLFVDSSQEIQIASYNGTDWTLLNPLGASIPSGSNVIPQLNVNQQNGNVYVSYQDGNKISTQYFTVTPAPEHFYVNPDATGNNDGSSWADAFTSLHDGLAAVKTSLVTDALWVAQGTYKPHATDRTKSFVIPTNANVYGGFNGTETQLNERNWRNNPTIFSGDLLSNDNDNINYTEIMRYDNSYRVVVIEGNNTLIDGITITAGHANHTTNSYFHRGAAIYKVDAVNSVMLKNSTFTKNVSNREGIIKAAFFGGSNSFIVENCTFSNNFSRWGTGFSVIVESGAATEVKLSNSLFYNNIAGDISGEAGFAGSSMYITVQNGSSNFEAINNTFANNEDLGTQASNDKGTIVLRRLNNNGTAIINATLHNNIFYENLSEAGVINPQVIGFMNRPTNKLNSLTFTHNISNQTDFSTKATSPVLSNNIDSDPLFTDAANMDYSITASSPAVDTGDNTVVPVELTTDLKGFDRITNTTVDMGAYEYRVPNLVAPTVITQDIAVSLDANGQVSIMPSQIENGSTDDDTPIEDLQFSLDTASFTCADLGANIVTLSVTDRDGNIGTATATVTVTDDISPLGIAQGATIYLDASGNASLEASSLDNGSTDNCTDAANLIFSLDITDFSCADIGFNTDAVTLTIADASGNTDTEVLSIVVSDTISPVVITQNITVQLDANGSASISASDIDNGSSDNCTEMASLTYALDRTSFDCNAVGLAQTVTLTVTDASGNSSTSTATVTVTFGINDETVSASSSVCADGSSTTITTGGSTLDLNYYLRNSSDNSIVDGPVVGTGAGLSFNTGAINEVSTFNVLAQAGSTPNKALDFDGSNDYMSADIPANLDYSAAYTMEAWVNASLPGSAGYYPIFFMGNSSISDIEVYIQKNTNKLNIVYNRGKAGFGGYSYDVPPANQWFHLAISYDGSNTRVYYDGVEQAPLSDSGPGPIIKSSGAEFNVGYIKSSAFNYVKNLLGAVDDVRIWSTARTEAELIAAKDNCLSGTESGLVAYYDYNDASGTTATDLVAGNNGVLQNMDGNTDWIDGAAISCVSGCAFQMTTEVTLGEDDTAPVINIVVGNLNISLDANDSYALIAGELYTDVFDNCTPTAALIVSLDKSLFSCADLGDNLITLSVTDAAGNQTTATATVVISEFTAPTAIAQDITVQLDATGSVIVMANQLNNGSTDNCTADIDLTFGLSQTTFTCADLGDNTVILSVVDASGNQATTTATITVQDTLAPVANTQDLILELDANGSASITAADINNSSSDICTEASNLTLSLDKTDFSCSDLGANTVILTVTDASGNTASSTAIVTIGDNTAPTAIAKDINVRLDIDNNASIIADDIDDGSSDNCNLTLSLDITTFDISDLGANAVTLTADDGNGNTSTATATVTIQEYKQDQSITFDAVADKTWGDADFDITASASSGLALSYAVISGSVTLSGNTASITATGDVVIEVSQAGDDDYVAVSELITFSINKAVLNVTADDKTMTYGESIPDLTFSYSGFVNGQDAGAFITEPSVSTTATVASNIGTYSITLTGGQIDNYELSLTDASLLINPAALTITADDKSITYGDALPELTMSYSGFVNSEDATVLTSVPSISTTASSDSDAGEYNITLAGGEASNYTISLVDATLAIEKIVAEIFITDLEFEEDGTAKTPTVTTNPAGLNFTITYDDSETAPITGGEYEVVVTIDDVNYQGSDSATLIINAILSLDEAADIQVNIYPNPVSDILIIDAKKAINGMLRIFNIKGVEVLNRSIKYAETQLSVTAIPKGLYILVIQDEKSAIIKKQTIIINR